MNTEDNIESLDDLGTVSEPNQTNNNVLETPESLNADPPKDAAPVPMNVEDMVSPTNLEQTDISSFGQEGIPLDNINQNPKPSSLQSVTKSDEYNEIGSVPENAHVEQMPKKQLNIKFILLLAIVLIILIGVGVFLYLRMGNKGNNLKLKDVKIQVSDNLSTNVNDYIASGKADSSCVANFDSVKTNTIGKYTYKIICNSGTYTGNIEVADETAPKVNPKIAFKTTGQSITEEDFVEECVDISGCSYSFKDKAAVDESINTAGTYPISIDVKDKYNNTNTINTYLVVTAADINRYLVCTSEDISSEDEGLSYNIKDTMGIINENNSFVSAGFTLRNYILKYSNDDDYNKAKATIKDDNSIETSIATGQATSNDESREIMILTPVTETDLINEFGEYPSDYSSLRILYQNNDRGFTCETAFNN